MAYAHFLLRYFYFVKKVKERIEREKNNGIYAYEISTLLDAAVRKKIPLAGKACETRYTSV